MKKGAARCHARPRYSSRRYTLTLMKLLLICVTKATVPRTRVRRPPSYDTLKIENLYINLYSSLIYLSYFHCCIFFCWSQSKKIRFLLRQLSKRNTFKTAAFFQIMITNLCFSKLLFCPRKAIFFFHLIEKNCDYDFFY